MIPIQYFAIENYKAYNGLKAFKFAPITFLIGKNSSGKSSLISALSNTLNDNNASELKNPNNLNYTAKKENPESKIDYFFGLQLDSNRIPILVSSDNKWKINYENEYSSKESFDKDKYLEEKKSNAVKLLEEDCNEAKEIFTEILELKNENIEFAVKEHSKNPNCYVLHEIYEYLAYFYDFFTNSNNISIDLEDEEIISESDAFSDLINYFIKIPENNYKKAIIEINKFKDDAKYNTLLNNYYDLIIRLYELHRLPILNFNNEQQIKNIIEERIDEHENKMKKEIDFVNIEYLFNLQKAAHFTKKNAERMIEKSLDDYENRLNELEEKKDKVKKKEYISGTQEFISKILKLWEVGDNIVLKDKKTVYIVIDDEELELTQHFGFGIQTIVALLLNVVYSPEKVLLIEEPEAFLHPSLQSKLADFFVIAHQNFKKQFIIETHSEYIIRRMQYLIGNSKYKKDKNLPQPPKDIAKIYYFRDPRNNSKSQLYPIYFKEDGSLTNDFDKGFIDESTDISLLMYMLNKNNN